MTYERKRGWYWGRWLYGHRLEIHAGPFHSQAVALRNVIALGLPTTEVIFVTAREFDSIEKVDLRDRQELREGAQTLQT